MRDIPSAYWIDKKSKLKGSTTDTLEGILADAAKKPTPPLTVFILCELIYELMRGAHICLYLTYSHVTPTHPLPPSSCGRQSAESRL